MTDKISQRIGAIEAAARSIEGDNQEAITILADTERAMKRAVRRAEAVPDEFERVEIRQSRGPTLEFTARLLAEHEWTTRGDEPLDIRLEVWLTRAGAMIAASYAVPAHGEGYESVRATVVPASDDALAMRLAVMDAFDWSTGARNIANKQLKWSLRVEVE